MDMTILDDLLPLIGALLKTAAALSVFSLAYCSLRIATAQDEAETYRAMLRRTVVATVVILTIGGVVPWVAGKFGADSAVGRIAEGISLWN